MTPLIRAAEPRDAEAVFALAAAFATSFAVQSEAFQLAFATVLADAHTQLLVAELDTQIIGYLLGFVHSSFYANGPVAWVEEIAVGAPYRRQGIGRQLMQEYERLAAERGAQLVALATRRAAAFYQALGYDESAVYFRKRLGG